MVKLTAELILSAQQYVNPVREREIDLRGYNIPCIENLGVTLDQFDCIDLSDNDIRKLDGFPLLKRLKSLLLNNNRIVRIVGGLEHTIPNIETIVLTGNLINHLRDLDPLAKLPMLRTLSLLNCPIVTRRHYRDYVAFMLPQLKILDFRKIKKKERDSAIQMFKGAKGAAFLQEITRQQGGKIHESGYSSVESMKIKEAIDNARTFEEVEHIHYLLEMGEFPGVHQ